MGGVGEQAVVLLSYPCEPLLSHSTATYSLAYKGEAVLETIPVCGGAAKRVRVMAPRLRVYYRVLVHRLSVVAGLPESVVEPLVASAFLLHDLGKALADIQEGYRGCEERVNGACCVRPGCRASAYLHEVFSASALYGAMTMVEYDEWLPVLAVSVLAVLNHHHAMRSLADERVRERLEEHVGLKRYCDETRVFIRRVMGMLKGEVARVLEEKLLAQLGDPAETVESLIGDILRGEGVVSEMLRRYRWIPYYADAVTGLLSIADYVAASAARGGDLRGFGRRVAGELGIIIREM